MLSLNNPLITVCSYLSLNDIGSFAQTCKQMAQIVRKEILWKLIYDRNHPKVDPEVTRQRIHYFEGSYKELVKNITIAYRNFRKSIHNNSEVYLGFLHVTAGRVYIEEKDEQKHIITKIIDTELKKTRTIQNSVDKVVHIRNSLDRVFVVESKREITSYIHELTLWNTLTGDLIKKSTYKTSLQSKLINCSTTTTKDSVNNHYINVNFKDDVFNLVNIENGKFFKLNSNLNEKIKKSYWYFIDDYLYIDDQASNNRIFYDLNKQKTTIIGKDSNCNYFYVYKSCIIEFSKEYKKINIWEQVTGKKLFYLEAEAKDVFRIWGGVKYLIASIKDTTRIFSAKKTDWIGKLTHASFPILDNCILNNFIITQSAQVTEFWCLKTKTLLYSLKLEFAKHSCLINENGYFIAKSRSGKIKIWDIKSNNIKFCSTILPVNYCSNIDYFGDCIIKNKILFLVTGKQNQQFSKILLFDIDSGQPITGNQKDVYAFPKDIKKIELLETILVVKYYIRTNGNKIRYTKIFDFGPSEKNN